MDSLCIVWQGLITTIQVSLNDMYNELVTISLPHANNASWNKQKFLYIQLNVMYVVGLMHLGFHYLQNFFYILKQEMMSQCGSLNDYSNYQIFQEWGNSRCIVDAFKDFPTLWWWNVAVNFLLECFLILSHAKSLCLRDSLWLFVVLDPGWCLRCNIRCGCHIL